MKNKLKSYPLIRENYRRVRKIVLHLRYGRFYRAAKLTNHYNPIYRLAIKNPIYVRHRQKQNLERVLAKFYPDLINQTALKKKPSVALILREGNTFPRSSAFIRLLSPLAGCLGSKINIDVVDSKNIALPKVDFVIIQRTAIDNLRAAKKLIESARNMDALIIVDNDDAFNHISQNHPEYAKHQRRIKAFQTLIEEADQIWLSEETLIDSDFRSKSVVIKNSLDKNIWTLRRKPKQKRQTKRIQMVYMGTATHNEDLQMILPALEKLNYEYPGSFRLKIIGVSEDLPDEKWISRLYTPRFGALYPTFVQWFLRQGPFDIGLSPLVDSDFNRAKSDIKCLDYIAAGIMPVVSNVRPYQNKEIEDFIIKVNNNSDAWLKELASIVADPKSFRKRKSVILPRAQKYLWRKRSAETTAKKISELLRIT